MRAKAVEETMEQTRAFATGGQWSAVNQVSRVAGCVLNSNSLLVSDKEGQSLSVSL